MPQLDLQINKIALAATLQIDLENGPCGAKKKHVTERKHTVMCLFI